MRPHPPRLTMFAARTPRTQTNDAFGRRSAGWPSALGPALALLVVWASWVAPPAVHAGPDEDRARAEVLVQQGLVHARAKNFRDAIGKFEAALKLLPAAEIQHNLARAHEELGELEKAYGYFRQALQVDYTYATDGRQRLAAIERRLKLSNARLTVRTTPSKVNVVLTFEDGTKEAFISTPFETWVPAGRVVVVGTNPDFKDGHEELLLDAGEDRQLNLVLVPLPKQGFLQVNCNVAGATIVVDNVQVGTAPMQSIPHNAGIFELRVSARGYEQHVEQVVVNADQLSQVSVALKLSGSGGAPESTGPPQWLGWTAIGLGGALVATGVILHADAFSIQSEANTIPLNAPPAEQTRYDTLHDKAVDRQSSALLLYGLGAAVAGTGIVLLLLHEEAPEVHGRTKASEPSLTPLFSATPDYLGAGAALRF